jgi:hypothetical protein
MKSDWHDLACYGGNRRLAAAQMKTTLGVRGGAHEQFLHFI